MSSIDQRQYPLLMVGRQGVGGCREPKGGEGQDDVYHESARLCPLVTGHTHPRRSRTLGRAGQPQAFRVVSITPYLNQTKVLQGEETTDLQATSS